MSISCPSVGEGQGSTAWLSDLGRRLCSTAPGCQRRGSRVGRGEGTDPGRAGHPGAGSRGVLAWPVSEHILMKAKVAQLCPTLCNPVDYTVQGILQVCILELGSFSLLQGIVPTQGSNPGLLHCRWILYQLSHKGSPCTDGLTL